MSRTKIGFTAIVSVLLVAFLVNQSFARWPRYHRTKSTVFTVGYFDPKDTKSGALFGLNFGGAVDETVDLGFSVNLFHRSYQRDTQVATSISPGGLVEHQIQRTLDFNTTALPLLGTVRIKLNPRMPFTYILGGGLGYAFLWNNEKNYVEGVSEKRFYRGFMYQLSAGVMFELGSRSHLIGELFYNGANLTRNKEKNAEGLPVWQEVDLSGFGFRLGIQVGG